ncbi:MAG: hypothetical protein ACOYEV_04190 [Candidatus Nanopelagicales bacterium]
MSAQEKKIAKGKEAIRAYNQMVLDIYASPDPRIDDLYEVAHGIALANAQKAMAKGVEAGWTTTKGIVVVPWVKPVEVRKKKMVLYACVDRSDIKGGRQGETKTAYDRVAGDYWIERIENRWLVTRTVLHGDATKPTPC